MYAGPSGPARQRHAHRQRHRHISELTAGFNSIDAGRGGAEWICVGVNVVIYFNKFNYNRHAGIRADARVSERSVDGPLSLQDVP